MAGELIDLDAERAARAAEKPMGGREALDEFEYLLNAGTHPLLAAQMLGMKYATLNKLANRYDRAELFQRVDIHEWKRFVHDNGRAA